MAKASFAAMKLKINDEVKVVDIFGQSVEVKQYLPVEEKNNLIEISLQHAARGTVFNDLLLDAYFHVFLVFKYTNINFTDKQKEDILTLYDILECNDVITEVISAIPEQEYNNLRDEMTYMAKQIAEYMISAKAIADDLMQYAPDKSAELAENVANFDIEKYQQIMTIAKEVH